MNVMDPVLGPEERTLATPPPALLSHNTERTVVEVDIRTGKVCAVDKLRTEMRHMVEGDTLWTFPERKGRKRIFPMDRLGRPGQGCSPTEPPAVHKVHEDLQLFGRIGSVMFERSPRNRRRPRLIADSIRVIPGSSPEIPVCS